MQQPNYGNPKEPPIAQAYYPTQQQQQQQPQQPYPPQQQQMNYPTAAAPAPVYMDHNSVSHQPLLQPQASRPPTTSFGTYQHITVGSMMPTAPPLEACGGAPTFDASRIEQGHQQPSYGDANFVTSAGSGQYFSPQEIDTLNQQYAAMDAPKPTQVEPVGEFVVQATAVAQATPVLVTQAGVPIFSKPQSYAVTSHDGHHGQKSCDKSLNNFDSIMEFFQTYNTRPRIACRVHGCVF